MRSIDTFKWLLESSHITTWRADPHSKIWLHGIPGCGKTVFASALVETLTELCHKDQNQLLAYYFFEFASREKGTISSFLCAVLSQLVAQRKVIPDAVQDFTRRTMKALETERDGIARYLTRSPGRNSTCLHYC